MKAPSVHVACYQSYKRVMMVCIIDQVSGPGFLPVNVRSIRSKQRHGTCVVGIWVQGYMGEALVSGSQIVVEGLR